MIQPQVALWYRQQMARRQSLMNAIARARNRKTDVGAGESSVGRSGATKFVFTDGSVQEVMIAGELKRTDIPAGDLVSVEIGTNVTSIGKQAFQQRTGLKSVVIPGNVKIVKDEAFWNCFNLTDVTICDGVEEIQSDAFNRCNIKDITIPASVAYIRARAFAGCTSFTVDSNNSKFLSTGDLLLLKDGTVLVCSANVDGVTIPNGVTSIEGGAFYSCTNLTSVTIPDSVTSIGDYTFQSCTNLTGVTIPSSVTSIGAGAFDDCTSLTSVTIPDDVTSIEDNTFQGCTGLTSMTIPGSITSIGSHAFQGCTGLTSMTIPGSVTSIGKFAFQSCKDLMSVTIPDSVTSIGSYAFQQCNSLTSIIFDGNAPVCSVTCFFRVNPSCTAYVKESSTGWDVDIPGTWQGIQIKYLSYSVTFEIGSCGTRTGGGELVQDVVLGHTAVEPQVVGVDEGWEFTGWDKDPAIEITADTVFTAQYTETIQHKTEIVYVDGSTAEVLVKGEIKSINDIPDPHNAVSINVGYGVTKICPLVFSNLGKLTSITLPTSLDDASDIGWGAFINNPNLIEYHMPGIDCDTVKANALNWGIGVSDYSSFLAVVYCKDGVVVLNDSAGGSSSGDDSGLTKLTYEDGSVKTLKIKGRAQNFNFSDADRNSAVAVELGDSVTSVGGSAFGYFNKLKSVTIPGSVTEIKDNAFIECKALEEVHILDLAKWCGGSYLGNPISYTHSFYLNGMKVTDLVIPNGVTSIGDSAFSYCSGLTSVTIPDSAKSIKYCAFYECSGLKSVTIPNSVTSVEDYAFKYCSGLTSVTIPDSVTSIGEFAFDGCSDLANVTIIVNGGNADNVKQMMINHGVNPNVNWVIQQAGDTETRFALEDGTVETRSITGTLDRQWMVDNGYFDDKSYEWLKTITQVDIGSDVTSIEDNTFQGCTGLTSMTIPGSVTSIGKSAFQSCSGLESVTIGNGVKSIGSYAFLDCSSLTSIIIPDGVTSIGDSAFYACSGLKSVTIPDSIISIGERAFVTKSDRIAFNKPKSTINDYIGRYIVVNYTSDVDPDASYIFDCTDGSLMATVDRDDNSWIVEDI